MIDNAHVPQRLEGEQEIKSNLNWRKPQDTGSDNLEQVSLEAVINVLIKRGLCTEAELFTEEKRLRAVVETADETTHSFQFEPVQTHSERQRHLHRRQDSNRLRQWAGKRSWSRKIGTLLFGWKWHRKKTDQKT